MYEILTTVTLSALAGAVIALLIVQRGTIKRINMLSRRVDQLQENELKTNSTGRRCGSNMWRH